MKAVLERKVVLRIGGRLDLRGGRLVRGRRLDGLLLGSGLLPPLLGRWLLPALLLRTGGLLSAVTALAVAGPGIAALLDAVARTVLAVAFAVGALAQELEISTWISVV